MRCASPEHLAPGAGKHCRYSLRTASTGLRMAIRPKGSIISRTPDLAPGGRAERSSSVWSPHTACQSPGRRNSVNLVRQESNSCDSVSLVVCTCGPDGGFSRRSPRTLQGSRHGSTLVCGPPVLLAGACNRALDRRGHDPVRRLAPTHTSSSKGGNGPRTLQTPRFGASVSSPRGPSLRGPSFRARSIRRIGHFAPSSMETW